MMNWDDFKYLLEISRSKNLEVAADKLGVSMSTVFRRLEKIEHMSGGPLFNRTKQGYMPNDVCEELLRTAGRIETEVNDVKTLISDFDSDMSGKIRITGTEVLISFFVNHHIGTLSQQFPSLEFELIAENKVLDLSSKEADIALRAKRPTNLDLFGRRVCDIQWGIYGVDNIDQPPNFNDLIAIAQFPYIRFSNNLFGDILRLTEETHFHDAKVLHETNNLASMASLIAAGVGMGPLPCIIGEQWPGLKCYGSLLDGNRGELWIVCHKDSRRNAKVKTLFNFIVDAAEQDKKLFRGPSH